MSKNNVKAALTATALLFAALSLLMGCAKKDKSQEALPDNEAVSDTASSDDTTQQQSAAAVPPDTSMPQASPPPVLKINGKATPDVYLQSLDIQIEVTGNIATTKHTLIFKNKTNRILEGELTFPLPDGRSITHYALDINGKMRDAVPVEKARATQVFEEIEQREVDPGLMERVEGYSVRARVYPIPARGSRTITVGYEEELPHEQGFLRYRLLTAYPDTLETFKVTATVRGAIMGGSWPEDGEGFAFDTVGRDYVAAFTRKNYVPSRTLAFALPAPRDTPKVLMEPTPEGAYFLASVAPDLDVRAKRWGDRVAIIWDVSLSGLQRDLRRELEALEVLFAADKKNANVFLYFLNNRLKRASAEGYKVVNGNWDGLKAALSAAVFDGGTDFSQINMSDIAGDEILFFSDGISTLSDAFFLKNGDLARPIHCIVSSPTADYSAMRKISGRTGGKFININDISSAQLKYELLNETPQFLGVEHGGSIREVYPAIATPVLGNFSIAGISCADSAGLTLLFGFGARVEKRIGVSLDALASAGFGGVHKIWAQKKIATLDLDYEASSAEIGALGAQFGIVTRNTSLVVLETVSDYIRYNILPPRELRDEYQRIVAGRAIDFRGAERSTEGNMIDAAAVAAIAINEWWGAGFTRKKPKSLTPERKGRAAKGGGDKYVASRIDGGERRVAMMQSNADEVEASFDANAMPARRASLLRMDSEPRGSRGRVPWKQQVRGGVSKSPSGESRGDGDPRARVTQMGLFGVAGGHIRSSDVLANEIFGTGVFSRQLDSIFMGVKGGYPKSSDYLDKLTGDTSGDYKTYLELRGDYAELPMFYFDMADWFYTRKSRETALRILTNIAELELENASLYRLLGYRFKEYGVFALEKFVCKKVIEWRPMEPQGYRDYALALDDNGERQAALDSLYALISRPYSQHILERSAGIEEVAVTEINRLTTKYANLDASKMTRRMLTNVPVDIRVVINWNINNANIDLYVEDPHGEVCYSRNRQTAIGGRISADNRSGYGPEQFMLKNAIKGKYRVYVNYIDARPFATSGPATVMAEIYTKYADKKAERRQVVCLQLSKAVMWEDDDKVLVAEFKF